MRAAPARALRGWARTPVALVVSLVCLLLAGAGAASAQTPLPPLPEGEPVAVSTPLPRDLPELPDEYLVGAEKAFRIADRDAKVVAEKEKRGSLTGAVDTASGRRWEVGFFDGDEKILLVVVDGVSGEVRESWTGIQVTWPMARGRTGQFGHILNAPYVWIPLACLFLFGLFDWRNLRRLVHLDLLVLLSFGISHVYFNNADIGVSVPLYYPPLIYLLGRMLWIGFRARAPGLNPTMSVKVMLILCLVLIGFRTTINIADSGVIDVGYAGVVGADRISDAEPIYGENAFPDNNPHGDTYGPANYYAYVPFEQVFPWSGAWDTLPAARAAALFFDLLCIAGLFVLGRRLGGGGNRLAAILTFAWLAYPYSAFVLQSNSNDSLLAALLIWSLVLFAGPVGRGVTLGLAAMTKFAPLALAPLYLAGSRGLISWREPGASLLDRRLLRPALLYGGAFGAAVVLMLAHPAVDPGFATFWDRTIGSQAGRESPFSIWGQVDLELLHTLVKLGVVGLAIAVALVPRRRDMRQVAALAAAVMIGVQITLEHWFYLYIVWFMPMLLLALVRLAPDSEGRDSESPAPAG